MVRGPYGITDLEHAKCKEWSAIINVLGERDSPPCLGAGTSTGPGLPAASRPALSPYSLQPTRLY